MNNYEHLMEDMTLNKLWSLWSTDLCHNALAYHGKCVSPCSSCVKSYLEGECQEENEMDKLLCDIKKCLNAQVYEACCVYKTPAFADTLTCDECDWSDGIPCSIHVVQDIYTRLMNIKKGD